MKRHFPDLGSTSALTVWKFASTNQKYYPDLDGDEHKNPSRWEPKYLSYGGAHAHGVKYLVLNLCQYAKH